MRRLEALLINTKRLVGTFIGEDLDGEEFEKRTEALKELWPELFDALEETMLISHDANYIPKLPADEKLPTLAQSLGEQPHDPEGCHLKGRPHLGPCTSEKAFDLAELIAMVVARRIDGLDWVTSREDNIVKVDTPEGHARVIVLAVPK